MVLESNTLDVLFVKDGQQGEDGKVLYTWIKYAKDANGTGITDDPNGAVYIGISYNNESSIESNDPTHYAWTKIQGADGKKGEDAYTIFLENENISFATDKNRNPLSEQAYTSGITIMKGAKPVTDFTIGDIAKTQGIAVAKTDTAIAISVVNGNPLPNDSGEIEIPVTVGGTVFKKILTWTCAKKGEQGEKGEQGIQGPQGEQGIAGKDGTSVTITNKSITYQLSTSGTTIPTGTWQTTPQAIPEGQYQWTKTFVTYSDGNKTESYSISYHGKNGSDGTSVKTTSTSVKYQVGDSGTTKPTGTWQSNVPTVAQGKYLWTQTIVNYSDGNSTESYSVSYRGIDGSNGVNGMNVATIYLYQRATSTPGKPSNTLTYTFSTTKITGTLNNGWSTAIPTGTDAVYVTVASVSSKNDTATIATSAWSAPVVLAQNGKTGSDGKAGLNVATIYLYQRNTSKPSKPSASVTYTFSTGVASGLNNGWSQKIPDGTNPLYVTLATASSNTATDTILSSEWSDVVVMAQNGSDGQDGAGFHWNLLKYSGDLSKQVLGAAGTYTATVESIEDKTTPSGQAEKITYTVQGTGGKFIQTGKYIKEGSIKQGKTYTVSVWCKCSSIKSTGVINAEFLDNKTYVNPTLSTEWQQYVVTGVANKDVTSTSSASAISFYYSDNMSVGDIFYISSPKVEEGDKASPWCTTYEETLAKNLTITPSSQYFKSTDGGKTFAPNAITIKATIQGEINFGKWQYSIDGGVSFADAVSGQKGLTISNNVLTVSKDSSLYSDAVTMVTFRAVASDSGFYDTCSIAKIYDVSDIGDGRNLLWNSNFAKTDEAITGTTNSWGLHTRGTNLVASIDTSTKHNGFNTLKTVSAANGDKNSSNDLEWFAWGISERTSDNLHSKNQNYTLSFYAKASVTTDFIVRWGYDAYGADTTRTLTTNWQKYEIKLHQATSAYSITIIFKLLTAGTVWFSEFKLEKGSSATGYSTAPEDLQTAILSTKSEISDVSSQVDKNKQAIEQRVTKTTYQQDLTFVKGDISKANEGLNKWRYEIYPKSLFASEYQGKSTIDVFAKNKNLTPSQSVLINDTDLSIVWNYAENYIGYALTFTKFSAAKSVAITFAHDDGAHIYLNGKLIGGSDAYNQTGESLTLGFVKGWNCIEVVVNEGASTEGFKLGTTLSALPECQLMNCYYGTPVARQSHITNQLVENTTNIDGISTKVSKVTSVIGEGGENFTSFKNEYSDFKQTMNGFKTTVSQTYVTKDDFNGLEIGGRNLLLYSQTIRAHKDYYGVGWLTDEVETFNGCPVWSVKNQWGRLTWLFKSHVIDRGLVKVGDTLTYSLYAKTNNASGKSINCSYRFKGNANAYWFNGSAFNVGTNWTRYSVTFTITKDMLATDTYMTEIGFEETASMSGDDKVYYACPKLERGTKATDYTPALEDNEINGQNLVSNLSSNWEQGSVSYVANSTYASIKTVLATRLRTEDVFSVSGNVTISAGTSTNSSKEELNFYYVLFDVNKKAIGVPASGSEWQSLTSPKIINCGDAKYMAIILRWGSGSTVITPSNISQICLKIERGTSATPFTLAPEDVNGKIVNAETIANQTANKFSWIVKSGTSASNFEITDKFMNLVSTNINLDGIVSFMNTAKGDGRKNLYNLDYSSFENVASQEDAICYAKDNGVTSVGIDSSVSYDGDKSLKISYTTANLNSSTTPLYLGSSTNNYGCVKIQAGKQYILSCYVKSDSTTGMFMIDIQGHDTPDTKTNGLYLSNIDPRKLPGSSTGVNLSTDWQRAVCAIKVADNATGLYWSVVPLIWGKPSSSNVPQTFNVWVDCIMLEEVDSISNEPGTYILDKETIIDGGSVKADTITGNQILAGSITADKIATDAIKSHNYISSGGTQGSFLNLGDGSFTSPNLSWDSNGNLIAKNANIIGNLTAGTVGEWKIDKYIYSRDKMFFDINKHNGQSIYNKNSTNNLFLGDGKVSSFYWFTTQNNTFIIENGNSPQYATGPAGISFGTNIAQGQIELYESVYPGNIIQDYEQTSHTSELSISGSKISFSYYDSNGSSFSDSPYTYIMADYARFYGDIFVQGSITTDEGVDVGGKLQASSIATKNGGLIETAGTVYGGGEIQCGGGQMRIIGGNYGILLRNDGSDFYILSTDSGSPWGSWNSKRPFRINLANGIPYFEYGIIIPNENYLLGNGYQLARGTSWGGVCIGDDSKRLRLYGTSIWASHSISTSDENLKENFTTLDQYEEFYMNLNPIGFNYIGDYDGKKTHFGFGAHKIEDILESEGYDADKFAVVTHRPLVQEDIEKRFGKDVTVDIETEYGVSYAEFIALNTHMIQKTRRELTKVKQEKADLEARLQIIEAKLGL